MKHLIAIVLSCALRSPCQQRDLPADRNASTAAAPEKRADYVLGPGDQIAILVINLETHFNNRVFRIDMSGNLTLPFVGRIQGAGLSTAGLEDEMRARLARFLKNPEVVVSLSTFASQPVSILGAVNTPGIRQLEGHKTLFEILSLAGGLRPDAGYLILVTRNIAWGEIPLPTAKVDSAGRYSTASVRVKDILNAINVKENIQILPGDTISVPKADVVYAVGSVVKPGGFLLNEHETLSALQVVSLAGGIQRTASGNAKILRLVDGSLDRVEIPIDLKKLMTGKGADEQLRSGDILFVPNSMAKSAGFRTVDAIVNAANGAMIFR